MSDRFDVVWRPDQRQAAASHTARFMARHGIPDLTSLRERSVREPDWFWASAVEYLGIPFDKPWRAVMDTSRGLPWTTWFTGSLVNLSTLAVDRWAASVPDRPALRTMREDGKTTELTYAELQQRVASAAGGLAAHGVGRGDAVAGYLPMSAEAVISMLATARLGAVFVPIFSGFGAEAVATRLSDPKPKTLICADGFERRGVLVPMEDSARRAAAIAGGVETILVAGYAPGRSADSDWDRLLASPPMPAALTGSEDPFLIAYTSGTTGRPKGAVHVHGGFPVQVAAEAAFQFDITGDDVVMWLTDMGWIMGPWVTVAALASGATLAVYDGAPDHPGPDRLWEAVSRLGVTMLGVSPTLIRALRRHGPAPARGYDLSRLRAFGSTGEPWNPDPWWWLFEEVGERRRPIVNITGGTEIGACLLSVNLLDGIKPTSVGAPALGIDADVYDDAGRPIRGAVGELVVRGAWPGRTRGFWNDPERYLDTYWRRFEQTWVHGDWASVDEEGFWFLHGRSDDTLNVAGKRLGPAEIESVAVGFPEVSMAAAIGVPDEVKGEVIALYLVPSPEVDPDDELTEAVRAAVADALGKSFRPRVLEWVSDIPRTRSAKILRRVVRAVALGTEPGDLSSLENPESLEAIPPLAGRG